MFQLLGVILTVLFVYLKLTHVIDWGWWWVASPIIALLFFTVIMIFIGYLLQERAMKKLFR